MTEEKFVTYHQLKDFGIRWSRVWLAIKERDGEFPRRVRLGARTVGWSVAEITEWMEQRKAARPQVSPEKTNA
ncbi:MAG: helix-turn-helix transcriptional regulator [Alphaproteobacteria bacterium]